MPPRPDEPLSADEKATLRRWIEQGAKGLPDADAVKRSPAWTDHWAFGPATHPSPPKVHKRARVRNCDRSLHSEARSKTGV